MSLENLLNESNTTNPGYFVFANTSENEYIVTPITSTTITLKCLRQRNNRDSQLRFTWYCIQTNRSMIGDTQCNSARS